jgi:hypothetical protein
MINKKQLLTGLFFVICSAHAVNNLTLPSDSQEIPDDAKLFSTHQNSQKKELTILLIIQARNNLAPFAIQNLRALTSTGVPSHINFVIQWEQPNQNGVYRYLLEGNQLIEKHKNLHDANTRNPLERAVSAFNWTIENYPAKKIGVVWWNHGFGAVDPVWGNAVRFPMYLQGQRHTQRADLNDIVHFSNNEHRAMMFDEENRVYLKTEDLMAACHQMSLRIGRKLDFIGFDACFMSSAEIWSLVHPFAQVGIGSAEIELATGWHYSGLIKQLKKTNLSPQEIAKIIVSTYDQYYAGKTQFHTQTAIELSKIPPMSENLNLIAQKLSSYMDVFGSKFKQLLIKARKSSLEYANPIFVDLYSFYDELHKQLSSTLLVKGAHAANQIQSLQPAAGLYNPAYDTPEIKELKELLLAGKKLIDASVIHHTTSSRLERGGGYGIYYPCRDFYDTYSHGAFAKISEWPRFVKKFHTMVQEREFAVLL